MKNIMVCGSKSIGKTALIHKYLYNKDITEYRYTVGVQIKSNSIFALWETPFEKIEKYIKFMYHIIVISKKPKKYVSMLANIEYTILTPSNPYLMLNTFKSILELMEEHCEI